MRRNSIFYKLFQQAPTLLFELLPDPPDNAAAYRFDSVAIKEPRFEIDGVFLPPEGETGTVYFCEVQFQKDEQLYERVVAESLLYFYRNRSRFNDWQVVIIYPSRRTEQSQWHPYQELLDSHRVYRVYLDELGEIRALPVWMALMLLTIVAEDQAVAEARYLLGRTQAEAPSTSGRAIMEMVITIIAYRFERLSRIEVEAMLDITLQETRLYQDIKEEGREEGERSLILRLLARRVGTVPDEMRSRINALTLEQLENLGEALLDFESVDELQGWLAERG